MRTDGNAAGMAALASIRSTAGPDERHTAAPPKFVAMTCTGMKASSRFRYGKGRSDDPYHWRISANLAALRETRHFAGGRTRSIRVYLPLRHWARPHNKP